MSTAARQHGAAPEQAMAPGPSTRPIRALIRGLDALTVLNLRNGASVSEVASEIRLPRTTTYRILETLCRAGYVYRDARDDRYRLTILVRGLSDGFDDEAWVTEIARPFIHELCREIVWPVAIATLSGTSIMVRETTDHASPIAVERTSAGFRVPVLTSASGRAYLAHCSATQRDTLLDLLAKSPRDEDRPARNRDAVLAMLTTVRDQGYATAVRPRRVSDEISIAVPIEIEQRVLAVLAVRFSGKAIPMREGVRRFLPLLRQAAAGIRTRIESEPGAESATSNSSRT